MSLPSDPQQSQGTARVDLHFWTNLPPFTFSIVLIKVFLNNFTLWKKKEEIKGLQKVLDGIISSSSHDSSGKWSKTDIDHSSVSEMQKFLWCDSSLSFIYISDS